MRISGYDIGSQRTVFAREQRFSFQHLGKDTAGTPNVNRDIVLLPGQHDFRGPIVPC